MSRAPREYPDRIRGGWGWTLIEILFGLAIVGVLSTIGLYSSQDAREKRRVTQAIVDIRTIEAEIESYALAARRPPPSLADVGWAARLDPWGRPYRYLRFDGIAWVGQARLDRFDVPINTTYDLYSVGRDGETVVSLQLPPSWDDVVRATDGAYVGLASRF